MKKTIALPLIAALALGVAACKKSDDTTNVADNSDLNAAANDAIADVNAATENATDNSVGAVDNAAAMDANSTNAM